MDTKPLMMLTTGETPISFATTGDKGTMTVVHPMNVIQIGVIITTAGTAASLIADFDRRITPGSDTGRVAADLGTLSKAYTAIPIGTILKKDVNVRVDKGDQIVVEETGAGCTACAGIAFVLGYAAGEGAVVYSSAAVPLVITVYSD